MKNYLTILFLLITSAAFAQKTNFSGTFTVEAEKIDWGPAPHWILPAAITVSQTNSQVTIIRNILDAQGTAHPDTAVLVEGKAYASKTYSGNNRNSALHWNEDGKTFTLTIQTTDPGGQSAGLATEVWSLSDDGKELLITRTVDQQTNNMKYTIKAYFIKQ